MKFGWVPGWRDQFTCPSNGRLWLSMKHHAGGDAVSCTQAEALGLVEEQRTGLPLSRCGRRRVNH